MQFFLKLLVANAVIITCVRLGSTSPSLSGLIATMPLTSLLVLIWLRLDYPENNHLITSYTTGVLWGIIPTVFFFAAAHFCLKKQLSFPLALSCAFTVWLIGALLHQWLVK